MFIIDRPSNSFFILPAGQPHAYGADTSGPWTIYWVHFHGSLAPEYAALKDPVCRIIPSPSSRIRERNDLFEEIFTSLDRGLTPDSFHYACALFHHYIATLRYLPEYRGQTGSGEQDDIVDATIHFLEENVEKTLTLEQMADYSGFSASYLSAVFRRRTGQAPLTYFNHLKIRQACRLLTDTDMKMNSICHKVGISDPYYFSRLFSKVIGISPSEYRRRSEI
ncbi:MAG: AraC family transcriptional regulator [Muribaculaceae bacterium]|nr:AraC family transcriptional regulator [Muribaculaceae bacterium]